MKVIKRNGSEVEFDISKIINAISKANDAGINKELTEDKIKETAETISCICEKIKKK